MLSFLQGIAAGAAINALLAAVALRTRAVDRSGALAGGLIGTAIYGVLGWRGLLLMATFVALGTAATRVGSATKKSAGIAQEAGGRRGARNALANLGVAALAALFSFWNPTAEGYRLAFAAALAAAASDTLSSEIGQVYGHHPRRITDLRRVTPGTDGAVSLPGTLAGLAGALTLAALGGSLGLYATGWIAWVTVAGMVGNVCDSLLGATLERWRVLDNEGVNFASTLAAALVAGAAS